MIVDKQHIWLTIEKIEQLLSAGELKTFSEDSAEVTISIVFRDRIAAGELLARGIK